MFSQIAEKGWNCCVSNRRVIAAEHILDRCRMEVTPRSLLDGGISKSVREPQSLKVAEKTTRHRFPPLTRQSRPIPKRCGQSASLDSNLACCCWVHRRFQGEHHVHCSSQQQTWQPRAIIMHAVSYVSGVK